MSRLRPHERDLFSSRTVMVSACGLAMLWVLFGPSTPAQAGLAAFLVTATVWLWLISRKQLDGVRVERGHLPRVFQEDRLEVRLRLARGEGLTISMLQIEDQCMASLDMTHRELVPLLPRGWMVQAPYRRRADRHRGLYLMGPVKLRATDPLGVFGETRTLDCLTRLTIYPRADALPDYRIPGPLPTIGPSLDVLANIGQGEEVLGVREYVPGDAASTVHWRTSARRGRLHVIQRNRSIQTEVAVLIDLTRRSRFGLGGESTTELAILAAISVLTRAHEGRHRTSLSYAHAGAVHFGAGSGMAHLHLLLDRLAILHPDGETDFWTMAGERALALRAGSRAVLIGVAQTTPLETAVPLVYRLIEQGVAVDCVLIDERAFIRIWRDQEANPASDGPPFEQRAEFLRLAGARVWPVRRGQRAPILRPAALVGEPAVEG